MKKIFVILAVFLAGSLVLQTGVLAARKGRDAKFKHTDKNKDGIIDKKEWRIEKKKEETVKPRVDNWWEKRADTDGDGIVDDNEIREWKRLQKEKIDLNGDGKIDAKERRLCWRHARSRVNAHREGKYDINSNGWLEPEEVRVMLRDRYMLIKKNGMAKVNTEIEQEYDTNGDGIIDSTEAEALKQDTE